MFDDRGGDERGGAGRAAAVALARPDEREDAAGAALARLGELVARASELSGPLQGSGAWSAGQRAAALRLLDRLAGVLATARAGVVVAEQAAASTAVGDRDVVAARARASRTGLGEARKEVAPAQTLTAMPVVAGAVAAGRVPVAHLDVLARATTNAGERAVAALGTPVEQERLVRLAERLSVREFRGAVDRLVASDDPASLERGLVAQQAGRFLVLSHQSDGVHLRGRPDVLAGARLRAALDAVGIAPAETRDKEQADADALVALVERATSGMAGIRPRRAGSAGGVGVEGRVEVDVEQDVADARVSGVANRPVVSILIPAETFTKIQNGRRGAGDTGASAQPVAAGLTGNDQLGRPLEPATLADGTPIPLSKVAQALCDCQLGRIVLDADSVPLDLGRPTRLFSAAQRRAVILRDRACGWNGREVPAAYGEIHHIHWWDRDDGPTDDDNAVLLCTHHHHVVHQHDLTIIRLAPDAENPRGEPRSRGASVRPPRAVPDEPVRYEFRRHRAGVVNGPTCGQAPAPSPAPLPEWTPAISRRESA